MSRSSMDAVYETTRFYDQFYYSHVTIRAAYYPRGIGQTRAEIGSNYKNRLKNPVGYSEIDCPYNDYYERKNVKSDALFPC